MRTKPHNVALCRGNPDRLLLCGRSIIAAQRLKSVVAGYARYESAMAKAAITVSLFHAPAVTDCFWKYRTDLSHEPDGTAPATPEV
jgi:hypothetical protein